MSHARNIIYRDFVSSCFFRSSVNPPNRKALIQITERCNLHCVHCFVSAGDYGDTMPIEAIQDVIIPRLKKCRTTRVSLTGGEPFLHPDIIGIVRLLRKTGVHVSICTSATNMSTDLIESLAIIGDVHLNVSLDGFRPESHGKFRGNIDCFYRTIETVRRLARYRLLQGLLVTPNNLAEVGEYAELCDFASQNGARYVLMNPLSSMGRGVKSKDKMGCPKQTMQKIRDITNLFKTKIEIIHIRFPNDQLPLASCEAGNIIYVFVNGEVTVCPYLVFAASTPQSKHRPEEFIVGNILNDVDIADSGLSTLLN